MLHNHYLIFNYKIHLLEQAVRAAVMLPIIVLVLFTPEKKKKKKWQRQVLLKINYIKMKIRI